MEKRRNYILEEELVTYQLQEEALIIALATVKKVIQRLKKRIKEKKDL